MNNGAELWVLKENVTRLYKNKCSFKKLFHVCLLCTPLSKPGLQDNQCIPPVAKRAFGQDWWIVGK